MVKRLPLTDEKGEVRELTKKDLQDAVRFSALPESLQAKLATRRRGPQQAPTKERITVRLSREVLEHFRAMGDGWQTRMDEALKEWLKAHPNNSTRPGP
ncbi:MAG: BrnA antitoxin family protein [Gammaproteobacteria bacterium]